MGYASAILGFLKGVGAWLKTLLLPLAVWWGRGKQLEAADAKADNKELREEINALHQRNKDRADIAAMPDAELDASVYRKPE